MTRMANTRAKRFGFTLIELLVVVAIIALLVAILLPSLEAARRQGKKSTCMAHIKNIATSSRVYEADDAQGWGIPVHPGQYLQDPSEPTFIGAYEWGGKSGVGRDDFIPGQRPALLGSKYGTRAGFGPATRPMNEILYKGGFKDNTQPYFDRLGAENDTKLDLELFKCPSDDGPPRVAHCQDWIEKGDTISSYDWFGNSYAANVFMTAPSTGGLMNSNSPYMRPITRVPSPARTLYYEENIGRWAWAARNDPCTIADIIGVNIDPFKAIEGWHGDDWTYNRAFVDAHAETQRIYIEGSEDAQGYAEHYRSEQLSSYPGGATYTQVRCIIVRGPAWQKDTLPAAEVPTGLEHDGDGRPSYESCPEY
jgi:prepilin-type N-terminal cleavage/methylation domain-containing protein